MQFDIISSLSSLYRSRLKADISTGIPVLIISFICAAYTVHSINGSEPAFLAGEHYAQLYLLVQFFVVGLISSEEFVGARFLLMDRVSTNEQRQNANFEDRLEPMRKTIKKEFDGEIVSEVTSAKSGSSVDRDDLEIILDRAKSDDFDVLGVSNLDRLSRANPWETVEYLISLKETGVTLYEHPMLFFAWDDTNDFQHLAHKALFSHEWLQRLREGRIGGVHREINDGRWVFDTHFGYGKIQDDDEEDSGEDDQKSPIHSRQERLNMNLFIDETEGPIIYKIFKIYDKIEDIDEAKAEINDRFANIIGEKLSKTRIETVLGSKICIGKLEYDGTVVTERAGLATVPEDLFRKVQSLRAEEDDTQYNPDKIPEVIADKASKLGIEYIQSVLEQLSFRRCKKCGGELEPYSKTEVWDIPVEKVRCKDCDYDGTLLSEKDFLAIHQTAPLRCPFCYKTERFEVDKSDHGLDMYQYSCKNCSHQFHTDVGPNKYLRYQNNSEMGVEIHNNSEAEDHGKEEETPSGTDRKQSELTDRSRFG